MTVHCETSCNTYLTLICKESVNDNNNTSMLFSVNVMTSILIIGMCLNLFSRICVNSQMESSPTGYMALSK